MVALVGFEIEKLKTNEFPHSECQVDSRYLGGSILCLDDQSIVLVYELRVL